MGQPKSFARPCADKATGGVPNANVHSPEATVSLQHKPPPPPYPRESSSPASTAETGPQSCSPAMPAPPVLPPSPPPIRQAQIPSGTPASKHIQPQLPNKPPGWIPPPPPKPKQCAEEAQAPSSVLMTPEIESRAGTRQSLGRGPPSRPAPAPPAAAQRAW